MKTGSRSCQGFALVLVLLALLVLFGIASAAVAASVGQIRSAVAGSITYSDRAAAEAGVNRVLARTRGTPLSVAGGAPIGLNRGNVGPDREFDVVDLRLSPEVHVFLGRAGRPGGVRTGDGRVVWWLDPVARTAGHGAAIEAAGIVVDPTATIGVDSLLAERPDVPSCGHIGALREAFGTPPVAVGPLPGPPEWGSGPEAPDLAPVRLGWLGWELLLEAADQRVSGSVGLGACGTCWSGVMVGEGSIDVTGQAAGVLVADGDVRLGPAAAWTGLVLAGGSVTLGEGASITGLVRAGGQVTLAGQAHIDASACAVLRSLSEATGLARPIPFPGRSWVGPISSVPS